MGCRRSRPDLRPPMAREKKESGPAARSLPNYLSASAYQLVPSQPPLPTLLVQVRELVPSVCLVMKKVLPDFECDVIL